MRTALTVRPTRDDPDVVRDIRTRVILAVKKMPDEKVYYELCKNFKWHNTANLMYPMISIALHNMGLTITAPMISHILGISNSSAVVSLHRLGNLGILTLKQTRRKLNEYYLNPRFIRVLPDVVKDVIDDGKVKGIK